LFSNLRFEYKIWLLLFIVMSSVFSLQLFDRFSEHKNLMESRQNEIHHLVENTVSLMRSFYERRGILGDDEAKKQAINAIKQLRYDDGDGYFWINDYSATIIMHPIKPALTGKDMSAFEDPNGIRLFSEFVKTVRSSEKGFVDYYWSKPGEDEPVAKTSFVQGFKPWNLIIGTGVYIDDIDALFWSKSKTSIMILLAIVAVVGAMARVMTKDMIRPLKVIVQSMKLAAGGDFTNATELADRGDELGELNKSFTKMQSSFKALINHSINSSNQLTDSSKVMTKITTQTTNGVNQQHTETELLASAIEELATTIQEVANNAAETSVLTHETNKQIDSGNDMMANTIDAINSVSDDMNEASVVIGQLESDVKQIDTILSVIRNISEQTNLLALNAAIEAARAGETGRGFAVVADEVRSLAQRTHESTEEIQTMTEALQSAASNAVKVMENGKAHTQACVENANTTGACLSLAGEKVAEVSDRNNQIAATVEQQGIVANEVSRNVISIKDIAQETSEGSQMLSESSQQLKNLTIETQEILSKYKI